MMRWAGRDLGNLDRLRGGLAVALALSLLTASPPGLLAQGFGIYEQGACAMGRAGATVAAPCNDGSAALFNPAAIAGAEYLTMGLGGLAIHPRGGYTSDLTGSTTDLSGAPITVGHAYASFPIWTRLSGGIAVYAPYGLETKWPESFAGRFVGYDNTLQTLYFQGTVAARVTPWFSLGLGPILALSSVDLNRRLDLSTLAVPGELGADPGTSFGDLGVPQGTDFVDATVDSDEAVGYGFAGGAWLRANDRVQLGMRYLSPVTIDYEGFAGFLPLETGLEVPPNNPLGLPAGASVDSLLEASGIFLTGGPFSGQEVAATLTLPAQVVVGVAVEATEGLVVEAGVQRTLWSEVDRIPLAFANEATPDEELTLAYQDANTFRIGAEYSLLPALTVRGGYIYNEEASPPGSVTPLLPEAARSHLTAGLGWSATDQIRLDLAYQFVSQQDRSGRVQPLPPGSEPTPTLNEGEYAFRAHLASATLSWRFR